LEFDWLINLVYFVVGLVVGIMGLWQNQKFFLAGQQDKFNQIAQDVRDLNMKVAVLAEETKERSAGREMRLLDALVARANAVQGATDEAAASIRQAVQQSLQQAGVADAVERTRSLEAQVAEIIAATTDRAVTESRGELTATPRFQFGPYGETLSRLAESLAEILPTDLLLGLLVSQGFPFKAEAQATLSSPQLRLPGMAGGYAYTLTDDDLPVLARLREAGVLSQRALDGAYRLTKTGATVLGGLAHARGVRRGPEFY
jgi:hypothetical protein